MDLARIGVYLVVSFHPATGWPANSLTLSFDTASAVLKRIERVSWEAYRVAGQCLRLVPQSFLLLVLILLLLLRLLLLLIRLPLLRLAIRRNLDDSARQNFSSNKSRCRLYSLLSTRDHNVHAHAPPPPSSSCVSPLCSRIVASPCPPLPTVFYDFNIHVSVEFPQCPSAWILSGDQA